MNRQKIIRENSIFQPDYSKLISRSDLSWRGCIYFGPYGIPIANGRFGGPVWQKNASTLSMQLNHTDLFMYNDASAQSRDESGAMGRIDIEFGNGVFNEKTEQTLSLFDARLSILTDDVKIYVIADVNSNTVLIRVTDHRKNPEKIRITLNMMRKPEVRRGLFSAISKIGTGDNGCVTLRQTFEETCSTEIKENDFYCQTAVAVSAEGRRHETVAYEENAVIILPEENGDFILKVCGETSMDKSVNVMDEVLKNCNKVAGYDCVYTENQKWWEAFWRKSYIYLPGHKDFEQRRNYYMYLAGISNRGDFPSKYNGGNWIAEGDRRDWGNWYWNWNQDSLYQPLGSANHGELMEPMFKMRERCYSHYQIAAGQLWGIENEDAIFIGETSGILGAEILPETVATDMKEFLADKGLLTDRIMELGDQRNGYLIPWNYKCADGKNVSFVTHTMVATQETAEYFWQRYQYTKDIDWLREHAYKFIKGAAELYRNYYGFVKEEDGRYHFNCTNLHEHIWGGRDVIDDLALARGIFAIGIKASEILDTDAELRNAWKECLENLAPYPLSSDEDAIGYTVDHRSGKKTWAIGRKPAHLVRGINTETPQFKMLEKFDVLNMETRDQKLDHGDWEIAVNTFYDTPGYENQYRNSIEDANGSSRFLEDAAKLGMADELQVMFYSQYKMFHNTPNLLHDQGDYYSAEGYGTWAAALQQALNQSNAPVPGEDTVIRVFPAWPKSWNAKYKLLAKNGFLVSSSIKNGKIEYVEIESQIGEECRIRNPWDTSVDVYRNGVQSESLQGNYNDLFQIKTDKGETIVFVEKGTNPFIYITDEVILN